MSAQHAEGWNQREFLGGVTVAGAVGVLGLPSQRVAAEPPPETTTLRHTSTPGICLAPQYVPGEPLRGKGFTERGACMRRG
jgi:NitT/TauT family transport system substrate-binding protein